MKNKTVLNWSGGKDASLALYHLLKDSDTDIHSLLTTVGKETGRVTMHGVPLELIELQAKHLNLAISFMHLPYDTSMESYNNIMRDQAEEFRAKDITHYAFGDIFLEDLKDFRDQQILPLNIKTSYPLWKRDTKDLAREFIKLGFKAVVVAVSGEKLNATFAGRNYDESFLKDLPENVDWCGENGEFHTFVFDGPIFTKPVPFKKGKTETHTYETKEDADTNWDTSFHFCELIPG